MCGDDALPVGYIKPHADASTGTHSSSYFDAHVSSYYDACISTHVRDEGSRYIEPSASGR
jgi:hypothetical protein